MRYKSTRGGVSGVPFKEAVLMGLAPDGGLLVPEEIPRVTLEKLRPLHYRQLALEIFKMYTDDMDEKALKGLIDKSYESFAVKEVVEITRFGDLHMVELFHGPTLSFKDVALQFLGNLFEHILKKKRRTMNVLGATSGDTGSAAIHGLKGKKGINVFILHPHKAVSPIQELQMTTVKDKNIFNLAIEGTFDDCQRIVKDIFSDPDFKEKYRLGAVNSINWARILAQMVYYFYAYYRAGSEKVMFSVPTGNFGNIFAGYLARKMGLPVDRLILATNENDILTRFVHKGDYSKRQVISTISPAMDIQVASNFERYLYYFYHEDPHQTRRAMFQFLGTGDLHFEKYDINRAQEDFTSHSIPQSEARKVMEKIFVEHFYFICPHTACGVGAALREYGHIPRICLATAHPAKFPVAVEEATRHKPPVPPVLLQVLNEKDKRLQVLPNDRQKVMEFIVKNSC